MAFLKGKEIIIVKPERDSAVLFPNNFKFSCCSGMIWLMLILGISLSIFVELLHTVTQLNQTVGIKTSFDFLG